MKEEKLKEAFLKIKEDVLNLGKEISGIREQLLETNSLMKQINEEIIKLKLENISRETPTHTPTDEPKTPTNSVTPTDNPTDAWEIGGLKSPNLAIPTGNEGVPTDRQTNQQTDQHIFRQMFYPQTTEKTPQLNTTNIPKQLKLQENVVYNTQEPELKEKPIKQQISEAADILDSLDAIKKEIRRKFKRITRQEMLVFSTIYQLEEQDSSQEGVNYRKIAIKLGLSESSIRDYVHKMIEKGIPIDKEKLNNKQIILHISPELKKIASLSTIITLREI
mgnify:CR=1 FL=1